MIATQDAEIKHHTNTGIANKNPRTISIYNTELAR